MLYNYKEALEIYKTDYMLKKALNDKLFFKIEKGIYSDGKDNFTEIELVLKKYSNAFLVKDSALHCLGFVENAPDKIHLGTARNALRIQDKRIIQHFYSNISGKCGPHPKKLNRMWRYYDEDTVDYSLSNNNVQYYMSENKNSIRIFNLNALIVDVIRDREKYTNDEFEKIMYKFRDCRMLYKFNKFDLLKELNLDSWSLDTELDNILEQIYWSVWERKNGLY